MNSSIQAFNSKKDKVYKLKSEINGIVNYDKEKIEKLVIKNNEGMNKEYFI